MTAGRARSICRWTACRPVSASRFLPSASRSRPRRPRPRRREVVVRGTSSAMTRTLFGTDGMRGVANIEPMTGETVMRLGMAIAARLRQPGRHTRIAIGKDTRLSGYMFESALAAGIVSMGADVWLTGPLPTPGIAFITSSMRCDAGVVISASHNPFADNGIKVFARDGYKLPDHVELEIEALVRSPDLDKQRAAPGDVGYHRTLEDSRGRYIVFCKSTFPTAATLVGTVMSNIGLERAMRDRGGIVVRTQVGDRYVVEEMRRAGYNFGGEQSGHLVFLDHATTGDGIVAALRVLAIMVAEGKPLSELASVMTRMPQVLVNLAVERKVPLEQLPEVMKAITDVEQKLGGDGRVLVRYSGTESKARVMIEGSDEALIRGWADEIAGILAKSTKSAT